MDQLKIKKDRFEKYLELLVYEGQKGWSHLKIHEIMFDFFLKETESNSNSAGFIEWTMRAHLEASMYHLFKIYDSHEDSININKFLKLIKNDIQIFYNILRVDIMKQVETDLHEMETNELIKNLRKQRVGFYAHIDKKHISNKADLFEDFPISIIDLKSLFDIAEKMLKKYSLNYSEDDVCFKASDKEFEDIKEHFEFVERAYIEEKKARIEKINTKYNI